MDQPEFAKFWADGRAASKPRCDAIGRWATVRLTSEDADGSSQLRHRHGRRGGRSRHATGVRAGRLPDARHHHHQRVSARRRQRYRDAAARRGARSRSSSSRSWSRPRPAPAGQVGAQVAATAKPDGYTLLSHNNGISGYAEVDKLFGRKPKTTRADFIPLARLSRRSGAAARQRSAALQDAQGFRRRGQEKPEAIVYSSGGLYGATPSAGRAAREGGRPAEDAPSADQWRRAGDHRAARQQRAGAARNRCRRRCRTSRPASCARSPRSAPSARRRCPTCRR